MASGTFKPSGLVRKLLFSKYETFYGHIRFQGFDLSKEMSIISAIHRIRVFDHHLESK